MSDNCWDILGLQPTNDKKLIKKHYAKQLRYCRPEEDAIGFQRLRDAYEYALVLAEDVQFDAQGLINEAQCEEIPQQSEENQLKIHYTFNLDQHHQTTYYSHAPQYHYSQTPLQPDYTEVDQLLMQLFATKNNKDDITKQLMDTQQQLTQLDLKQNNEFFSRLLGQLQYDLPPLLTLCCYGFFKDSQPVWLESEYSDLHAYIDFFYYIEKECLPLFEAEKPNLALLDALSGLVSEYQGNYTMGLWFDYLLLHLYQKHQPDNDLLYLLAQAFGCLRRFEVDVQSDHYRKYGFISHISVVFYSVYEADNQQLFYRVERLTDLESHWGQQVQNSLLSIMQQRQQFYRLLSALEDYSALVSGDLASHPANKITGYLNEIKYYYSCQMRGLSVTEKKKLNRAFNQIKKSLHNISDDQFDRVKQLEQQFAQLFSQQLLLFPGQSFYLNPQNATKQQGPKLSFWSVVLILSLLSLLSKLFR